MGVERLRTEYRGKKEEGISLHILEKLEEVFVKLRSG
ncbi:MAG: hypothetical protein QW472_04825 [Candidatus Aenigmatarchaeota archaeon]